MTDVRLDAYASLDHYAQHQLPVWRQLRAAGVTGVAYGPTGTAPAGRWRSRGPVMVAGYADYLHCARTPVVYVEHGAGQTYTGIEPHDGAYSGGPGLDRVVLFVCPSEQVAQRWRARYDVPAVAVGCPFLDRWHSTVAGAGRDTGDGAPLPGNRHRVSPGGAPLSVAVTFHWECRVAPETRGAWAHYDRALPDLVEWARSNGVKLLGHGHPRLWGRVSRRWRHLGVEPVADWRDVLDRADVLIADNTSAMFEFASLDRPVVVLNAPWYRRDVDHGGRFWQWADVGVQCDEPGELTAALDHAISDPPDLAANRRRIVAEVYAHTDGHAAERAATAIVEVLSGPVPRHDDTHDQRTSV